MAAILVIVFAAGGGNGGIAVTQVPLSTMESCQREAAKFGGNSNNKAYCVSLQR